MAITRINVGNIANDGSGDDLRQAFVKVNNNFDDLETRVVPQNDAVNLGTGTGIFYTKEGSTLNFRSLVAGDNIALTSDGTSVTVSSPGAINISTDGDTLNLTGAARVFGIRGGQNITTSVAGSNISVAIDPVNLVSQDTSPWLSASLNANSFNINNVATISTQTLNAVAINGPLNGTVNGVNVEVLNDITTGTDYGRVLDSNNLTSGLQLLFNAVVIDYGSAVTPASLKSDYGSI
jgi:hypothetical protein|tara:strand:+ start:22 stop:729 length:708 start_codon:yes stop_codon:yes gene_type:complete